MFYRDGEVLRHLSPRALQNWHALSRTTFFRRFSEQGRLVQTDDLQENRELTNPPSEGWAGTIRHRRIPFISYPYEWSFAMLKDAALLQLDLLLAALEEEMVLKDASAYNLQWDGPRPVFIDIPSFETYDPGRPWVGYRQFCQLFLYPLLLQAYKNVDFHPWLRGNIDGISPAQMNRLMSWRDAFRPGVMTHVVLQSKAQSRYADSAIDIKSELRNAGFGKELIASNARRLRALIESLSWQPGQSEWSEYYQAHSYTEEEHALKKRFVANAVQAAQRRLVWDLGANTGVFSRIAAAGNAYVVATDADHATIDRLYRALRDEGEPRILPLVCNLADPSPNLGWRNSERKSLIARGRPDLVLCLALIHHMVISANIPMCDFIAWLAGLDADLVIEFVTKSDPMVQRLLRNRDESYPDYDLPSFEASLSRHFEVLHRTPLPSGTRILYYASPVGGT